MEQIFKFEHISNGTDFKWNIFSNFNIFQMEQILNGTDFEFWTVFEFKQIFGFEQVSNLNIFESE
jgi:hypothetical protein